MFYKTIFMVVLLSVSFFSNAVETLDVLVVYEKNTISGYTDLNTSLKRLNYSGEVIKKVILKLPTLN